MKLSLIPIIVSLAVSTVVLFGGWFMYDSVAMEHPLSKLAQDTSGVQQSEVNVTKDLVSVDVKLGPDASLREVYRNIAEHGATIIGNRKLVVHVSNGSTPALDAWWSKALFEMAQAMDTMRYGNIPSILDRLASANPGIAAVSEMDDHNVYVRISDGTNSKYVTLPRIPARIGVWPNE